MNFLPSLGPLGFAILAAVPFAILALYFLKLKRQPVEVPSTYLWSRTIEDLHVNSLWQRLRQSLLLFLQLLLIALALLAVFRPGWKGTELEGSRYIFLIDTSASMTATDVSPNRLEVAKERVLKLIDQMVSGGEAMVISFSDEATIECEYTTNRRVLRQAVKNIQATNHTSDISEALRAASGLANPGQTGDDKASFRPTSLYIFSDGGFETVPKFSLGALNPEYIPIGDTAPHNVGIVAFNTERNPEKPTKPQAFARLVNCGREDVKVEVSLYLNDSLIDAASVAIGKHGSNGVDFEIPDVERGVLRLQINGQDDVALDNVAYTTIAAPRQANVLVVTPGNDALKLALQTDEAVKISQITYLDPKSLDTPQHQKQADTGTYDLIIYDRCVPPKMPQANTLFIGRVPPVEGWTAKEKTGPPIIIDTDRVHPLMELVEFGDVKILEGLPLTVPPGGSELISSSIGPLFAIAPRQGFEDAVQGFELLSVNEKGQTEVNTDWPIRRSFPVFVLNVLNYLGGNRVAQASPSVQPGRSIVLKSLLPVERLHVKQPSGREDDVPREAQHTFVYTSTERFGVYDVREGEQKQVSQQFTVNLFDERESDIRPREKLALGEYEVKGKVGLKASRIETWKWIVLAALGVLIFEWYVYNRRIYF